MTNKHQEKVFIVLLNYNNWRDTIACAQSVLNSINVNYHLVICDNDSQDGSLQQISRWAQGKLAAEMPNNPRLRRLLNNQTVRMQQTTKQQVEAGMVSAHGFNVTLIANGENRGFAAGNNVGFTFALQHADTSLVWLLNNDTLVEPDCLAKMLARLQAHQRPAIVGSRVMFMDNPAIIQALGGNSFNKISGNASASIGRYTPENIQRQPKQIEQKLDYISGCSSLISRSFLYDIGLMNESYFLYYEEIDWATRAKGKYDMIYADDAVLYHKEGSSIGSASYKTNASPLSEFYNFRNKILFTRKYYPWFLPTCYLSSALQIVRRAYRGYWKSAWLILQILAGKREYH